MNKLAGYTIEGLPTENPAEIYEEAMTDLWQGKIAKPYQQLVSSLDFRITEDELTDMLDGMFDTHIHAGPDSYAWRVLTEADVARKAVDYRYGGVVFKGQGAPSSYRQLFVKELADIYADAQGKRRVDVFGGVCLSTQMGGNNPAAVEASFKVGGKYVWTASKDAEFHHLAAGVGGNCVKVVDENGDLVPELYEIFKMIAKNDGILGIGHQSTRERLMMIDAAQEMGVKRIVLEHVQMHITRMSVAQLKLAASKGVYLGMASVVAMPGYLAGDVDTGEAAHWIREIGPEHFVAQTDLTQLQSPDPIVGIRLLAKILLSQGIPPKDIQQIYIHNPRALLY